MEAVFSILIVVLLLAFCLAPLKLYDIYNELKSIRKSVDRCVDIFEDSFEKKNKKGEISGA